VNSPLPQTKDFPMRILVCFAALLAPLAAHPGHGSGPVSHAIEHLVVALAAAAGFALLFAVLLPPLLRRLRARRHRQQP
jgi:Kef-type K+ transport system membrane component KefB